LTARLAPQPDLGRALTELGGAQLLAGDSAGAILTLDAAIKADPSRARAFFLRARAREVSGQTEASVQDYSLASRTAFAAAKDLSSGEAHLYRGISLYRHKDYDRAEDEFSSALNFSIPADLRPDAVAWRHLAAVASGACAASRAKLAEALTAVSPYFPKNEAAAALSACPASPTVGE
jgi:Tfp pilus assembly protein PilF